MDTPTNRKLLIAIMGVLFFAIIIIVWYFFYAKPIIAPSLGGTIDPIKKITTPPRFQFIERMWTTGTPTSTTEVTDPAEDPLIEIWNKPSTGQTFITEQILKEVTATTSVGTSTLTIKKTIRATSTTLLFTDKITGYIYGYSTELGKTHQISNTIIPGVYDAYFFNNGEQVIMRYFDKDKNKIIALIANVPHVEPSGNAESLQNIQYLAGEVTSIAINKEKTFASYIVTTQEGSSIYTLKDFRPTFVGSSPFKEWVLSYGDDDIHVTAKPSAYIPGAMMGVPSFQSEISEKTGLMTNPRNSNLSLNSMWGKNGLVTFFTNNGSIKIAPVETLASKCSWGYENFLVCAVPRNLEGVVEGLPDDWFQGRTTFTDDLFIVDLTSNEKYTLYSFTEEDGLFDIKNISINKTNDLITFNKRQDATLWLLNTRLLSNE